MADIRTVPNNGNTGTIVFRGGQESNPVPPAWYDGQPIFGYGKNPNLVEPLKTLPLSHTFSSPFVDGDAHDSYFTRTQTGLDIRHIVGPRDWSDIVNHPPHTYYQNALVNQNPVGNYSLFKRDLGFCIWHNFSYDGLDSSVWYPNHRIQLDVASGGKVLSKQDFVFPIRPYWYSVNFGNMRPCFGGFSVHEVIEGEHTKDELYEMVLPRIAIMWGDVNPDNQLPYLPSDAAYDLTTEAGLQLEVTAQGNYWLNFTDTSYAWGGNVYPPKLKWPTNGGYRQMLLFVGEFSLKQLHDYITDDEKFVILQPSNGYASGESYTSTYVGKWAAQFVTTKKDPVTGLVDKTALPLPSGLTTVSIMSKQTYEAGAVETLWQRDHFFDRAPYIDPVYHPDPNVKEKEHTIKIDLPNAPQEAYRKLKSGDMFYEEGNYYYLTKLLKPPKLYSKAGKGDSVNKSEIGMYGSEHYGLAKIDAYTYDGSAATPYKPVLLIERTTCRIIREAMSDMKGRYVMHGVPDGVEYIAVSLDPTKTFASTVEDFGEVNE